MLSARQAQGSEPCPAEQTDHGMNRITGWILSETGKEGCVTKNLSWLLYPFHPIHPVEIDWSCSTLSGVHPESRPQNPVDAPLNDNVYMRLAPDFPPHGP